MSVIISDTAPLRYLIEIEEVFILEKLFGQIIIPEKVAEELQHPKTPRKVSDWIQAPPVWLEVRRADLSLFSPAKKIGDGEREAFALALELKADVVCLMTMARRSRRDGFTFQLRDCLQCLRQRLR